MSNPIEDAAPNGGDGNGDGTPDSQQPNVTSLPSASGRGYITVIVDPACGQNRDVVDVPAASEGEDGQFIYPFGMIGFRLHCETATVTILFHGTSSLAGYTYRKFGPIPPLFNAPQFYTLPGVVFGSTTIGGATVATATFTLTNGGWGDGTDATDGTIVDPGGPATVRPSNAPVASGWGMAALVAFLSTVAWLALRRQRQGR